MESTKNEIFLIKPFKRSSLKTLLEFMNTQTCVMLDICGGLSMMGVRIERLIWRLVVPANQYLFYSFPVCKHYYLNLIRTRSIKVQNTSSADGMFSLFFASQSYSEKEVCIPSHKFHMSTSETYSYIFMSHIRIHL